ncbi:MAG TPA: cation:proton antiporter [Thermoanaerobaculia bacterium]|nr:cation:proton antiporter [Thermoanaerobaculia bacterium]
MNLSLIRKVAVYVLVIGLFVAAIAGILQLGSRFDATTNASAAPRATTAPQAAAAGAAVHPLVPAGGLLSRLRANLQSPLPLLLLQVVVIVVAARLMGGLFRRFHQPAVIGEMIAGILLGPSLLGWIWPQTQTFLFPPDSMGALRLLSQIGVVLFMFIVGIDLDAAHLRRTAHAAVWVSHLSITVPFLLGSALSLVLYRSLAPPGTRFSAFALFMGTAMSITAFPVLARILEDRGLTRTPLGATAIACAAVDDVTAWCLLALVVTLVEATALAGALVTFLLTAAFVLLMLLVVKPAASRLLRGNVEGEALVAGALSFLFLCALITEVIGIHALFGAFLAGVAMPRHSSVHSYLRRRLETFASVLLLPLFFAFTGLRTQIGLLDDLGGWLACAALIGVAIAGKIGGTMIAARITGIGWADSFALGAMMNTRGLVGLIVLDLGYDLGILSPPVFSMMVLMALLTTFMTAPLLQLHAAWKRRHEPAVAAADAAA